MLYIVIFYLTLEETEAIIRYSVVTYNTPQLTCPLCDDYSFGGFMNSDLFPELINPVAEEELRTSSFNHSFINIIKILYCILRRNSKISNSEKKRVNALLRFDGVGRLCCNVSASARFLKVSVTKAGFLVN